MKRLISLAKGLLARLHLLLTKKNVLRIVIAFFGFVILSFAYTAISTYSNPLPDKLERELENTSKNIINDVTELNPIQVLGIIAPHTEEEIVEAVKNNDHISIGGGRNSMGGQTASEKTVHIDMRGYNQVISLSTSSKEITVQSGIRWRDIQEYIDPYDLSVKIMQTYSNFTVGGSLSVNVHGRYVGLGPMIMSITSFRTVLADGSVLTATPDNNKDVYYSAIGGMGGIGVITDVTLELADNVNVERNRVKVDADEYVDYFMTKVKANPDALFHNGHIYPPNFGSVSAVSWFVTDKETTTEDRMIPQGTEYWKERVAWIIMSEWPAGRWIREHLIDPILYSGDSPVHSRNYEASYDIAELEPSSRYGTTYVLQEYFVPVENWDAWIPEMKRVFNNNDVNVINVSIRHSNADPGAKLAWARTESFAFVVYYKQGTDDDAKAHATKWTREMIDEVIAVNGTYYLPYQIHATDDQIHKAYPGLVEYFEFKKLFDPTNKFTNKLWDTYYSEEKLKHYKDKQELNLVTKEIPDYSNFDTFE
ncbi:MAG: FAD/FMN-containing dehydrogenase [Candidatus Paceibacteria bacterium]|jgi:FAD/FMN-containing dehydrogenase